MVVSKAVMKDKLLVDWRVWRRAEKSVVLMAAFSAVQWVALMVYVPAEWMAAMTENKLWAFWLAGLLAAARDDDSMEKKSVVQKASAKVIEMAVS